MLFIVSGFPSSAKWTSTGLAHPIKPLFCPEHVCHVRFVPFMLYFIMLNLDVPVSIQNQKIAVPFCFQGCTLTSNWNKDWQTQTMTCMIQVGISMLVINSSSIQIYVYCYIVLVTCTFSSYIFCQLIFILFCRCEP